jgi:transcription termination factor Rho
LLYNLKLPSTNNIEMGLQKKLHDRYFYPIITFEKKGTERKETEETDNKIIGTYSSGGESLRFLLESGIASEFSDVSLFIENFGDATPFICPVKKIIIKEGQKLN